MKKYFCIFIFLLSGVFLYAQSKRVFFAGNSYTAYNDLPLMVKNLAQSVGFTLTYESNLPGGCTFAQHCSNTTKTKIMEGNWDYVVLQEQSQLPSFPWSQFTTSSEVYADSLDLLRKEYNPCGKTLYYMTWGRKNGDQDNAVYFPTLGTYQGMDSMICLRYTYLANKHQAELSPVGALWRYLRTNNPSLELYDADESHPSLSGSYAAACAFVSVIFRTDPTLITNDYGLNANDARIIREAAKTVVYNDFAKWNVGKYDLAADADFTYQQENLTVSFEPVSSGQSYVWNFGDGNTSVQEKPTHQYQSYGTYEISLIVQGPCQLIDTLTKEVEVLNLSVEESAECSFQLYPNPSNGKVCVSMSFTNGGQQQGVIYDFMGRKISTFVLTQDRKIIDLSSFSKGVYLIKIANKIRKIQLL